MTLVSAAVEIHGSIVFFMFDNGEPMSAADV